MNKFKVNKKDRKFQIQQEIISKLEEEISKLKSENEDLKKQLSLEKSMPKEGYEKAKEIILKFQDKSNEYQALIEELSSLKDSYKSNIDDLQKTKDEYQAKIRDIQEKTKKNTKRFLRF